MGKIIKKDNPRVIIEPDRWRNDDFDRLLRKCESIKEGAKRHLDDIGYIHIEYDTNVICSHCGYEWEIIDGEPACCQKAIDEFNQNKVVPQ